MHYTTALGSRDCDRAIAVELMYNDPFGARTNTTSMRFGTFFFKQIAGQSRFSVANTPFRFIFSSRFSIKIDVDFMMFDTEKFIKLVKARPCLWDVNSNDYQNRFVKTLAWEDVGRDMHADWDKIGKGEKLLRGKILEKKWKNIKDCFARELKLQQARHLGTSRELGMKRKYLYFEHLLFLLPIYTSKRERRVAEDLVWEPPEDYQTIDANHLVGNEDGETTCYIIQESEDVGKDGTDGVRVKDEPIYYDSESEDTNQFFQESIAYEEAARKRKSETNDEKIGRSIAAELSMFKECKEKRLLKAKIFQLIADYDGEMKVSEE